uniref:Uncharacterized protein n=1 Tax=Salix viminalis TaxID=40686 RepID=A0A6N2NCI8_SALVM
MKESRSTAQKVLKTLPGLLVSEPRTRLYHITVKKRAVNKLINKEELNNKRIQVNKELTTAATAAIITSFENTGKERKREPTLVFFNKAEILVLYD